MTKALKDLTGLGYRAPYYDDLISGHEGIGWLEVISENYMWDQGDRRQNLEKLRENYDLAFHGVSLSIAAPEEHDQQYLQDLKKFCDELRPVRISDHLCWSAMKGHHWHDLLPFPYTEENLNLIEKKVNTWQDVLKRPLVLENLSTYVACKDSSMSEYTFLNELCNRTGCQMLLDLNNMVVNSRNFKIDPMSELKKIDLKHVAQIHLAGFTEGKFFAIDTHSKPPVEETWSLFQMVTSQRSDIPFMLEWDDEFPDFEVIWKILSRAAEIQKASL